MGLDHVAIYVKDLEKEKIFFEKYFNGKAIGEKDCQLNGSSSYRMIFSDGSGIELIRDENIEKIALRNYLGYSCIAFRVENKTKVQRLTMELQQDGYEVVREPTGSGSSYRSRIMDLEGNLIEITA